MLFVRIEEEGVVEINCGESLEIQQYTVNHVYQHFIDYTRIINIYYTLQIYTNAHASMCIFVHVLVTYIYFFFIMQCTYIITQRIYFSISLYILLYTNYTYI